MTIIYHNVRRAVYEEEPAKLLNKSRSFRDMAKLFKRPYWAMFILLLLSAISIIALSILILTFSINVLWIALPIGIILAISIIVSLPKEKHLYNHEQRSIELEDRKRNYKVFIEKIRKILICNGIDTYSKLAELEKECQGILKLHHDKFSSVNGKIIDSFILVPLGALVASIIYADSQVVVITFTVIIALGLSISGIVKLLQKAFYYSEERFKDQYLLNILHELNYVSELFSEK